MCAYTQMKQEQQRYHHFKVIARTNVNLYFLKHSILKKLVIRNASLEREIQKTKEWLRFVGVPYCDFKLYRKTAMFGIPGLRFALIRAVRRQIVFNKHERAIVGHFKLMKDQLLLEADEVK